ncbi:NAC domain-containing protein 83-like isoform X1 [Salvia splendens]|uniref:NAC domain-containing protein 83-like isoform X1 n=1 Tax=Salvia splendens TaxID=180675 RepID=UPI001C271431|nr:NAC domain-containing protein 83-like isoform X1 [Salvia splendens]
METLKLPIGFRFHPTDEELLLHYLKRKVLSLPLLANVIPELEAFQFNPSDLPGDLKEKRYFFCKRKRNLVNKCGYWKSSGKDKQIVASGSNNVIGIKKSFVFYQDRKMKTHWIMQELSLVGFLKTPFLNQVMVHTSILFVKFMFLRFSTTCVMQRLLMQVGDWVVCRLYQRKRKARGHVSVTVSKGASVAQTTSPSCSSGITDVSCSDLDQEASSRFL